MTYETDFICHTGAYSQGDETEIQPSKLGILWSVLNPLLSMAVLSLVFSTMFRKSIENYPVYYSYRLSYLELFYYSYQYSHDFSG